MVVREEFSGRRFRAMFSIISEVDWYKNIDLGARHLRTKWVGVCSAFYAFLFHNFSGVKSRNFVEFLLV